MTPEPIGSTHLRFDDARVIGKECTWLLNVVRSPRRDPGRHEEFRNGPEVKIYIWKVVVRVPGKVQVFSVLYREASRRFRRIPEGSGGPENVPPRPIQQHGL